MKNSDQLRVGLVLKTLSKTNETNTYFYLEQFFCPHLGLKVSVDSAETTDALRRYLANKKHASH
jgi:hypothetical protein